MHKNKKRRGVDDAVRARLLDIDSLVSGLEIKAVGLTECLISPGWRLTSPSTDVVGLHYNASGRGTMVIGDHPAIELAPHSLVIVPPGHSWRIDVPSATGSGLRHKEARWIPSPTLTRIERIVAGDEPPEIDLICGFFRATHGMSIDLFSTLPGPVIDRFSEENELTRSLRGVVSELSSQRIGMRAMTTALLTQVFVTLLRRSLDAEGQGLLQLSLFKDAQIARALSLMIAKPGEPHNVLSLSTAVRMSRSGFIARFEKALGVPPMSALRQLRMRQAAKLLAADALSVEQVARSVGYMSRPSFYKAFVDAHGVDPKAYRASAGTRLSVTAP